MRVLHEFSKFILLLSLLFFIRTFSEDASQEDKYHLGDTYIGKILCPTEEIYKLITSDQLDQLDPNTNSRFTLEILIAKIDGKILAEIFTSNPKGGEIEHILDKVYSYGINTSTGQFLQMFGKDFSDKTCENFAWEELNLIDFNIVKGSLKKLSVTSTKLSLKGSLKFQLNFFPSTGFESPHHYLFYRISLIIAEIDSTDNIHKLYIEKFLPVDKKRISTKVEIEEESKILLKLYKLGKNFQNKNMTPESRSLPFKENGGDKWKYLIYIGMPIMTICLGLLIIILYKCIKNWRIRKIKKRQNEEVRCEFVITQIK